MPSRPRSVPSSRPRPRARRLIALALLVQGCSRSPATTSVQLTESRWCDELPRPAYAGLERIPVGDDWFQVYRVAEGVFAIYEPFQFQEAISWLIVGTDRALLFDTGIGIRPMRPVVSGLTALPIEVLNSHTHYDHVGGNAEFQPILAMDTPYTRANARGFAHATVAGEVTPGALCHAAPRGLDTATFHTRAWTPSKTVADGEHIALGGRTLELLHVPGHTPDAVALLDRDARLLWTGDSYYEGPIWLSAPETDLDAYARSVERLAALAPAVDHVLGSHNIPVSVPDRLLQLRAAVTAMRSGTVKGTPRSADRLEFSFDGFSLLVSKAALRGTHGDLTRGGSGLPSAGQE